MNARLAMIVFVDGQSQVDPGYGVSAPGGSVDNTLPSAPPVAVQLPVYPFDPTIDNSLPSGRPERPDQGLPGRPARPDQGLPGSGARPDQSLPGSQPEVDNTLPGSGNYPSHQPIVPGARFVVKWLHCKGLILVPDNSLPSAPARPDQTLPPTAAPKK